MHQSAEEIQLHRILRNEQLDRDLLTSIIQRKRKAFGDVHHFSFALKDALGSPKSSQVLWVHHSTDISVILRL